METATPNKLKGLSAPIPALRPAPHAGALHAYAAGSAPRCVRALRALHSALGLIPIVLVVPL